MAAIGRDVGTTIRNTTPGKGSGSSSSSSGSGGAGFSGGGGGGGGGGAKSPKKSLGTHVSKPANPPKPPPTQVYGPYSGGGYDPGTYSFGSSTIDYNKLDDKALGGYDSVFNAQLAALQAALSGQQADFGARRSVYDVDMNEALKQLGITGQIFDDPTTEDVDESTPGQWNWRDLNTAAGRSNYNLKNDYASRGILQSSLFGDALTNLQRSLNEQVEGIGSSRGSFLSDLTRQQTAAEEENRNAVNNARAEALYRLASGIGI